MQAMLELQIEKFRVRQRLLAQGLSEEAVREALKRMDNEFRPAFVNGQRRDDSGQQDHRNGRASG